MFRKSAGAGRKGWQGHRSGDHNVGPKQHQTDFWRMVKQSLSQTTEQAIDFVYCGGRERILPIKETEQRKGKRS
jgi:hypothetical protein